MKEYILSKLSSFWISAKLLFYVIFAPAFYAKTFNELSGKFEIGFDAFKFTTLVCVLCSFIFEKIVGVTEYGSKIAFTEGLVHMWLWIALTCTLITILVFIKYRKLDIVNHFVGSFLFSFSSSLAIGSLLSTISINYYKVINPQTSFGPDDYLYYFSDGIEYFMYPVLFMFVFVTYITCVNAYGIKKSGIMSFKSAISIQWFGIVLAFILLGFLGEDISEVLAKWLQVFLSIFG